MPEPIAWQIATVTAIRAETPQVSSYTLALPAWRPHRAGQHYDVRLTTPDGYQAQRSYSIASPPSRTGEVDLTIERIADGEVSPYFHDVVEVGDRVLFDPEDKAEVEVQGETYVVMRERDVHAVAADRLGDESAGLYL